MNQQLSLNIIAQSYRYAILGSLLPSALEGDHGVPVRYRIPTLASLVCTKRQSFVTAATDQLAELQRRLAELTTVQRVARAINSTLDLDAIFQTVVSQINSAFNYQMVSIYLREGDGLRL